MHGHEPKVYVGDLELIDSLWAQITLDSQLRLAFDSAGTEFVLQLVEFDADEEPSVAADVSEDGKVLTVDIKHAKRIASGGFGTKHPLAIGTLQGREAYMSYQFHLFGDGVNANIALYLKKE